MSDVNSPLDRFGKFIVENMRDKGIDNYDRLANGSWKTPSLQALQEDLKQFDERQLSIIRQCVGSSIDTAIHDFLFALQESTDLEQGVEVIVDKTNVAKVSDGLHGEPFGEDGWYLKYSAYGEPFE